MNKIRKGSRDANRLINEKSPYLLQHAHNPVDWHPWGDEAFERAERENKPLLVSIGYSTCHWCHVMARESYEDPETARIMNEHFINIKVDREERPDIDSLYMKAVQAISGQAGWPLNAFVAPDGTPFYGGTYFPPEDSMGMPSFKKVLLYVSDAYGKNKDHLETVKEAVERALDRGAGAPSLELTPEIADNAFTAAKLFFDPAFGGFGSQTKFPHAMYLKFLLKYHKRTGNPEALSMVKSSLSSMASGGIYDHIGGGFHRYTVDERWAVPHFEKMLYDNALLLELFSLGYELTGLDLYRDVAEETAAYLLREMRSPEGGFYSAQDADVDGREGEYYVWDVDEVKKILGTEKGGQFAAYFSMTKEGNFEGKNTLRIDPSQKAPDEPVTEEIKGMKGPLFKERLKRKAPATDHKVISAWNGLVIGALVRASVALKREDLLKEAHECAGALLDATRAGNGRLMRYIMDGAGVNKGALEDYALLGSALISLYNASGKEPLLEQADELARRMIELFHDPHEGLFYDTGKDLKRLFVRERDLADSDIPSGNSAAASFLLALSRAQGDEGYRRSALAILRGITGIAEEPLSYGNALCVLETVLAQDQG